MGHQALTVSPRTALLGTHRLLISTSTGKVRRAWVVVADGSEAVGTSCILSGQGQEGDSLDPHNGVVELGVDGLQVFQGGSLVEHPLVERQGEACVDELAMV